jgi:hypothetical protein
VYKFANDSGLNAQKTFSTYSNIRINWEIIIKCSSYYVYFIIFVLFAHSRLILNNFTSKIHLVLN